MTNVNNPWDYPEDPQTAPAGYGYTPPAPPAYTPPPMPPVFGAASAASYNGQPRNSQGQYASRNSQLQYQAVNPTRPATAALTWGIASLLFGAYIFPQILAIVFGLNYMRRNGPDDVAYARAKAGVILGIAGTVLAVFALFIIIIGATINAITGAGTSSPQ